MNQASLLERVRLGAECRKVLMLDVGCWFRFKRNQTNWQRYSKRVVHQGCASGLCNVLSFGIIFNRYRCLMGWKNIISVRLSKIKV